MTKPYEVKYWDCDDEGDEIGRLVAERVRKLVDDNVRQALRDSWKWANIWFSYSERRGFVLEAYGPSGENWESVKISPRRIIGWDAYTAGPGPTRRLAAILESLVQAMRNSAADYDADMTRAARPHVPDVGEN